MKKNEAEQDYKPYNFYGIRNTRNKKYMSVTLVKEQDGERCWLNVPVNMKNIVAKGDSVYIKLKLLDEVRPTTNANRAKAMSDEDMPF